MNEHPDGLLLCDDLIFVSRIVGTARSQGLDLRAVKTTGELLHIATETPPRCVIVDLHAPGLAIDDLVRELSGLQPRPFLVGYGSHVDTMTLKGARDAGCDIVWPRSKFVDELTRELPEWFRSREVTS